MSHFSVHVFIADDEPYVDLDDHLHTVLAPFDEHLICEERHTGTLSDSEAAEGMKRYKLGSAEEYINDCLGYTARRNDEDTGWDLYTTTNPNAKWDWWVIGGRFEGTLYGGNGTTAYVDELNAEEAVESAVKEAHALYDRLEAATAGLPAPTSIHKLSQQYQDSDQAREVYTNQPWIKAAASVLPDPMWMDPMYFFCQNRGGREAFVLEQSSVDIPFAYVDVAGQWHSDQKVGMFGFYRSQEYVDGYRAYVASLRGDCEVVVVDMHI